MRKSNRPPEPGARGLLRLCCPCCGKEFGPAPGTPMNCTVPEAGAEAPMPGPEQDVEWLEGLGGE